MTSINKTIFIEFYKSLIDIKQTEIKNKETEIKNIQEEINTFNKIITNIQLSDALEKSSLKTDGKKKQNRSLRRSKLSKRR